MILHIGKAKRSDDNTYFVPYEWLNHKETHLFLASQSWDNLILELSDEIPEDCMKYLVTRCKSVTCELPDVISEKELAVLCEVYPEKAGHLRKLYIMGRSLKDELLS